MAGERANRRLTAIAMADVAGYSRLMEADETGTLAILLERLRTIVEPVVGAHGGRIIKAMGDGWLMEFASAVDAVTGMLDLQRRMAEANERGAASQRIDLRVGINLGDIISEGTDIYGDGVNIAARVEQLSEAGGICITGKVHDEVQGKVEVAFQDIGEHDLKNISRPVRVFRWSADLAATAPQPPGRQRPHASDRPGIAVLPFVNLSRDAEQQYLSDGITEDITTELSRFRQMSVASRSSSARFRGPDVDMIRAGRELDVAFLLEGSVRRMGDRVRITAQLIEAATGNHTWGDRYDCAQDEIFDAQDHVVRTVASTVCGRVAAAGLDHARRKPPASLAAYDYVLRGDALPWTTPASEAQAREMFRKAIEIDPAYARAHALLSFSLSRQWMVDMSGSDALRDESYEMARKAVDFDENDTLCQLAMVWAHVYRGEHEMAEPYMAKALALNPTQPSTQTDLGIFQSCSGEPEAAVNTLLEARRLDPFFSPSWYWGELGIAYFNARQYKESIKAMSRASVLSPWYRAWLAAAYGHAGRTDDAAACARELQSTLPDFSAARLLHKKFLRREEDISHLADGLRRAGFPGVR